MKKCLYIVDLAVPYSVTCKVYRDTIIATSPEEAFEILKKRWGRDYTEKRIEHALNCAQTFWLANDDLESGLLEHITYTEE